MTKYQYTNQKQIRDAFKSMYPDLNYKKVNGDYVCDTRVAFIDFIDSIARDNLISQSLAARSTLR